MAANGVDNVIFDFESTLNKLEAFPYWGKMKGVEKELRELTNGAITGSISFGEALKIRLEMVQPDVFMVKSLEADYLPEMLPEAVSLIKTIKALGKNIFLVSCGFDTILGKSGEKLSIVPGEIFANQLVKDKSGLHDRFRDNYFLNVGDKRGLVEDLKSKGVVRGTTAMVGDGKMDMQVYADLKIGFGGVGENEKARSMSDVYVKDLSAVLPMVAGERLWHSLMRSRLFHTGTECFKHGQEVEFNDKNYGIELVSRLNRFNDPKRDPDVVKLI